MIAMVYIFISHSWRHDYHYEGLKNLLNSSDDIKWRDYSIPKDDPIDANRKAKLKEELDKQIKCCSCVLIPAGVYATYSEWIQIEIEIANKYGKKIIAVKPWGSERISQIVQDYATDIVGWNTASIIKAIKEE